MDVFAAIGIILVAIFLTRWFMGPSYCICPYCGHTIRPYVVHKCKGHRVTCK